jgi:hypothetical protein
MFLGVPLTLRSGEERNEENCRICKMVHSFCYLLGIVDCVTNNAVFSIRCSSSSPNSQYCLQTHVL